MVMKSKTTEKAKNNNPSRAGFINSTNVANNLIGSFSRDVAIDPLSECTTDSGVFATGLLPPSVGCFEMSFPSFTTFSSWALSSTDQLPFRLSSSLDISSVVWLEDSVETWHWHSSVSLVLPCASLLVWRALPCSISAASLGVSFEFGIVEFISIKLSKVRFSSAPSPMSFACATCLEPFLSITPSSISSDCSFKTGRSDCRLAEFLMSACTRSLLRWLRQQALAKHKAKHRPTALAKLVLVEHSDMFAAFLTDNRLERLTTCSQLAEMYVARRSRQDKRQARRCTCGQAQKHDEHGHLRPFFIERRWSTLSKTLAWDISKIPARLPTCKKKTSFKFIAHIFCFREIKVGDSFMSNDKNLASVALVDQT